MSRKRVTLTYFDGHGHCILFYAQHQSTSGETTIDVSNVTANGFYALHVDFLVFIMNRFVK